MNKWEKIEVAMIVRHNVEDSVFFKDFFLSGLEHYCLLICISQFGDHRSLHNYNFIKLWVALKREVIELIIKYVYKNS